jgi:hypothetical protein
MVHEAVKPVPNTVKAERMKIDHWRGEKPQGANNAVLAVLEYAILRRSSRRDWFFAAREYQVRHDFHRALWAFNKYLECGPFVPAISETKFLRAMCFIELDDLKQARKECMEAIMFNPDYKAALTLMANMYPEPMKAKWQRIADNANDKDAWFGSVILRPGDAAR